MMGARFDLLYGAAMSGTPIPFAWDVWEPNWAHWVRRLLPLRLPLVVVTSAMSADYLRSRLGTTVECLPEATTLSHYQRGGSLGERGVDILELGRRYSVWHDAVVAETSRRGLVHLYQQGPDQLIFPSQSDMVAGLSRAKISVCFPSSITHPERSGRVATMTHRYLESMASRCLMVGTAPVELVELMGYNPVVEADLSRPWDQIAEILATIESYQPQVDEAYDRLRTVGDWSVRVAGLMHRIEDVVLPR
ncbi:MAG TPA: hypothetical protein VHV82_22720 [Sporichthyaceae bacterium]|nr:hypothetical protein [Sporichthyaceae bacterium]